MDTLSHAIRALEMGYSVIPVLYKSKRAAVSWKRFQKERPSLELVKKWFGDKPLNIGIVTGAISGITVVDVDNPNAMDEYQFRCNPSGLSVKTSRGFHFYHSYSPSGNKAKGGLDLRNDGGYVLGVGSVHENGHEYVYDETGSMTPFDRNWFEGTNRQLKAIMSSGLNYDIAVASCVNYVRKIDPAISGSGGHNTCFRAACKIAEFVGSFLSVDEAMPILRDYNERSQPPFSEQELRHKLESAYRAKGFL
ncbi:Bifunctional DNA primase/polymerase [Rhodopirellula maiorica SM1]|uniref:Bifunctional DNA primase/polymerase n=1 Tax=Rhodopirellula maiorica SM1 TaxID=1265738 RepID=M5RJS6_9BACT|nr:bifunctional DNA primase/polymerase [Rhodopirellula maiorica]EMI19560.1 Bifunctional DNA primase/polymerase [Rhodopirellula maiorica SM1]